MRPPRKNFEEKLIKEVEEKIQKIKEMEEIERQKSHKNCLQKRTKYSKMSYDEIRKLAFEQNIKDYWKKNKEALVEELANK